MTSSENTAAINLDPERPWITDSRDLPENQNWFDDLCNPFGMSSKLHFSRVWTFCFLSCFIVAVAPQIIFFVIGMGGVEITEGMNNFAIIALAVTYITTLIFSFIAHIRRLSHVDKSPLLAVIVLTPLIAGGAISVWQLSNAESNFEKSIVAKMISYEDADLIDGVSRRVQASAEIIGMRLNKYRALSKEAKTQELEKGRERLARQSASMMAVAVIAFLSFFVFLWQTLWMLRLPNPPKNSAFLT